MPYEPDPELQLQDALWAKRLLKYVVLYWTFALGKWFLFSAALVIGCVILFNTFFRDFLNQPKRLGGLLEVPSFWPLLAVLFFAFPFVFLLRWILKYRALLRNVERLFEQYGNLPKENFSEVAEINCSLARRAGVRPVEVVALDKNWSYFLSQSRRTPSSQVERLGVDATDMPFQTADGGYAILCHEYGHVILGQRWSKHLLRHAAALSTVVYPPKRDSWLDKGFENCIEELKEIEECMADEFAIQLSSPLRYCETFQRIDVLSGYFRAFCFCHWQDNETYPASTGSRITLRQWIEWANDPVNLPFWDEAKARAHNFLVRNRQSKKPNDSLRLDRLSSSVKDAAGITLEELTAQCEVKVLNSALDAWTNPANRTEFDRIADKQMANLLVDWKEPKNRARWNDWLVKFEGSSDESDRLMAAQLRYHSSFMQSMRLLEDMMEVNPSDSVRLWMARYYFLAIDPRWRLILQSLVPWKNFSGQI